MKIKTKAIIIIITCTILLLAFLFVFINPFMIGSYEKIEKELIQDNISRVENAISNERKRVSMIVRDYAVWDDTYDYMTIRNNRYINSNWVDDTFITNKIDFVIYYDVHGKDVFHKAYDFHQEQLFQLEDFIKKEELLIFLNETKSGFVSGVYDPILLSSHPIFPSSEDDEPNGTLIMGVIVDEGFISRISDSVLLPVVLDSTVPYIDRRTEIEILNNQWIKGSFYLPYLNTDEASHYHFTVERSIVQNGKQSLLVFYIIYLVVSSLFIFCILLLLDKNILSKIRILSNELIYIQHTKDLTRRMDVHGKDEIGDLEKGVNEMLDSLYQSQQDIKLLAITDDLTGLPNKKYTMEQIGKMTNENNCEPFAVLFLDIDLFKRINDTFGHHKGDYLLKTLADRLKKCCQKEDIVARWGGDEFVIIIKNVGSEQISDVCRRILEVISIPIRISSMDFEITTSIGISLFPNDSKNGELLIQNADIAMYEAKRAGKNQYVHYKDIEKFAYFQKYVTLENDLKLALINNEFSIYYQPIIRNNTVVSVEALLRWDHPTRGIVSPGEFIHVAEEIGLMPEIGAWVLEKSMSQVKNWLDTKNRTFSLSVNVSKTQLMDYGFLEIVQDLLQKYEFPPALLRLEITESDACTYLDKVMQLTKELNQLGVKTSLDDFGTGQSSLMYLKEVQVHEIKIDRHFVKNIPNDNFDKALLSGIIKLCKKLCIEVVAEGVETEEQFKYLSKYDISLQGYYFNKPLPYEKLDELLSEQD